MRAIKDTILRQWSLLRMVPRYPRSVGTRELKDRLEEEDFHVNVRTIQRDLEKFSAIFPLASEAQGNALRWSWAEDAQVMDIPGMDPATALAFRLAEEYLTPLLPQTTLKHLAAHFRRAKEVLGPSPARKLGLWPDKVRMIARGPVLIPPKVRPEVQDAVYQALLNDRQAQVTYQRKDSDQPKSYPVHPLALVFREGAVYLVCRVKEYDDVRHLALHRMSSAKLLDQPCSRPSGFNLDTYIRTNEELAYPVSGKPIRLETLFDARTAVHLGERPLSKDQRLTPQKDGRVLLQATVRDTLELRWWLLGFGDKVEVLGPKALREEFGAVARRMAGLYKSEKD